MNLFDVVAIMASIFTTDGSGDPVGDSLLLLKEVAMAFGRDRDAASIDIVITRHREQQRPKRKRHA